jgi:hypothetical protein
LTVGAPALPSWAAGKDFWNGKKPADWSDGEIRQMLSKSPWAKEVIVSYNMGQMGGGGAEGRGGGRGARGGGMGGGGMGAGGGIGGEGMGGAGGGMGGRGGGGMGDAEMAARAPQFKALVRWETALPVVEATKKQLPGEAAEFHLISVSGMPMMGMGGRGARAGGPQDAAERRREMFERLKESTQLQRKGKDPIYPSRLGQAQGGMLFAFARDFQPIKIEDKEVTFLSRMGPMELKVKFALKDMVYNGQLTL